MCKEIFLWNRRLPRRRYASPRTWTCGPPFVPRTPTARRCETAVLRRHRTPPRNDNSISQAGIVVRKQSQVKRRRWEASQFKRINIQKDPGIGTLREQGASASPEPLPPPQHEHEGGNHWCGLIILCLTIPSSSSKITNALQTNIWPR